jgi:uncharacterized repeat protein (TIGR01451 family)
MQSNTNVIGSSGALLALTPGAENAIALNGGAGVAIGVASSPGANSVRGNSIYSNGTVTGLGIDLITGAPPGTGVTVNDAGDGDAGPNTLQNFPVIGSALTNGTSVTHINGSLNSEATVKTYRVDFYSSPSCNTNASNAAEAATYGEGKVYLASQDVTTNASGNAAFSYIHNAALTVGHAITATATAPIAGPGYNTSEFSLCQAVVLSTADLSVTKIATDTTPLTGTNVTFNITVSNAGPDTATNVVLKDVLPAGLTFVSDFENGVGEYDETTGLWPVGTIPSGESRPLQIIANVTATSPVTNIAQVSAADQPDPDSTPGSTPDNCTPVEDDCGAETLTPEGATIIIRKALAYQYFQDFCFSGDLADTNAGAPGDFCLDYHAADGTLQDNIT